MKSESVHYQPKNPDLNESIRIQTEIISKGNETIERTKEQVRNAKKALEKLTKVFDDYQKIMSSLESSIIQDEATDLNGVIRGDDESQESYIKRLELAGKTERV